MDGKGGSARFKRPFGICFDEKHQSLLVCDYLNHKVKRVSLEGNHTVHFIYMPSLLFCSSLLILDVGDVSTVCIIEGPKNVVIANNIILVTANGGKIFRVTEEGNLIHIPPHLLPSLCLHSLAHNVQGK